MANNSKIFTPVKINKCEIKNRTSMAPMGPIGYSDAFGGFNQRLQDYYVERARYGTGLIITGICDVDLSIEGIPTLGTPCPTTNPLAFIHSTYNMNERIHAYGSKCFLQLTAGLGRSAIPAFVSNHIAPSEQENRFAPSVIHREMTKEEIMKLIKAFAISAGVAKKAGFDGVEIHAVHEGYLLDQFAIAFYNKRTDEFGGSLENRLRLTTMIIEQMRKVVGPDYPISIRYSLKSCMKGLRKGGLPGEEYIEAGKDIEEGIEAAKILEKAGIDAFNLDAGTYDSWYWNHPPLYFEEGPYIPFAKALRPHVNVPIILAGNMADPKLAEEVLEDGCADLVSYGRPLLADPELVEKIRTNRIDEIRPCLRCHEGCLGRIANGPVSCAVNPACGKEEIYALRPAAVKKNILIVGGGVAGLEAARVLATRGHKVTLCEATGELGGNLIPGSVPHFKRQDRALIEYYKRQMELLGVDVKLNKPMCPNCIKNFKADEVIIATGSTPRDMQFPGTQKSYVAKDILLGKAPVGDDIVVVGGGLVGVETALWLAQQGKKASVVEIAPVILGGPGAIPHMNEFMIEDLIEFHKIPVYKSSSIINTTEKDVTVKTPEGEITIPCDTLITSVGYIKNDGLFNEVKDMDKPVYNLGDSAQVKNIMYAIWNAYEIARGI